MSLDFEEKVMFLSGEVGRLEKENLRVWEGVAT